MMADMAQLQEIILLVEQSLDEPGLNAGELASRACLSRGVLAHVLTFAAVRRTLAVGALESSGIGDLGAGDPMRFVGQEGSDASGITRNFE
jgi:hypothetical protein